jgi:hypothetical protein
MDVATVSALSGLGVGGVLAYLVYQWKRLDDKAWADERKATALAHANELKEEKDRYATDLRELVQQTMQMQGKTLEVITTNTAAMLAMKATADGLVSLAQIERRLEKIEGAVGSRANDGTASKTAA